MGEALKLIRRRRRKHDRGRRARTPSSGMPQALDDDGIASARERCVIGVRACLRVTGISPVDISADRNTLAPEQHCAVARHG